MYSKLIDALRTFNAKERFFLIGQALGNQDFTLDDNFRSNLNKLLPVRVPENAFCAMDFHLDWLYASLQLTYSTDESSIYSNNEEIIKAHQEDIDLLIGFEDDEGCHIILIEAKGAASWLNKQMESKTVRMVEIFGHDGKNWPGITPHFILTSPQKPQQLTTTKWPKWMIPNGQWLWMELNFPKHLKRISRCNSHGSPQAQGKYWTIVDR